MATTASALQTAATTTLAIASGVTALWLTLGALDAPEPSTTPTPEVRIEYVDGQGNPVPNGDPTEPSVVVVDQFGEPYDPDAPAQAIEAPAPAETPVTTVEPYESEEAEYEYAEGDSYDDHEEEDHEEDHDGD